MKAVTYARVMPSNKLVAKQDRIEAQEKRCREFLSRNKLTLTRAFRDEGDFHPVRLMPGINALIRYLKTADTDVVVICDHAGRFGVDADTRQHVIQLITQAGGWPYSLSGSRPLSECPQIVGLYASLNGVSGT